MTTSKQFRNTLAGLGLAVCAASASAATAIGVTSIDITNAAGAPDGGWLQIAEVVAMGIGDTQVFFSGASASNVMVNDDVTFFGTPAGNAIDNSFANKYPQIYHATSQGESLHLSFATPTTLTSLSIYGRNVYFNRDLYTVTLNSALGPIAPLTMDATAGKGATATFTSPVPEPGELAMMLSGLATVGLIAKRRRKQA